MCRPSRRSPLQTSGQVRAGLGRGATGSLILAALTLTSCPHQVSFSASSGAAALAAVRTSLVHGLKQLTGAHYPHLWPRRATLASENTGRVIAQNENSRGEPGLATADERHRSPEADERSNRDLPNDALASLARQANDESTATLGEPERVRPLLYSIGRETWIYAEPTYSAKKLGYLRFGARTQRMPTVASRKGCSAGWYGIKPMGYVCANGRTATVSPHHPLAQQAIESPKRMAALPFLYARATRGIPRYFGFVPNELDRPHSSRRLAAPWAGRVPEIPAWLRRPRQVFGYQRPVDHAMLRDGLAGSGVALLGVYADEGTLYGVTPDLELVTTDGLEAVQPSAFAGLALTDELTLPVAFVMSEGVWSYEGDPNGGGLRPKRRLSRREAIALAPGAAQAEGQQWVRTKAGEWLRSTALRVVPPRTEWPEWARDEQVWVDVSISQQTLVAYEGRRAAYVTLVSTGVDGLMDPATSKSTKLGVFHVISKHLTATMDGEAAEDRFEMREVPWVQYFSEGYALHGAYWHDAFGQPRSHGCVNLSPIDARWLFHFTQPGLPQDWHGTVSNEQSATVYVHP